MAERKNVNKYYPPEWDPSKGSLNGFVRRNRTQPRSPRTTEKRPGGGFKPIRIEMPFDFWCGGCKQHIAMGVRFNSQKIRVGMYYSTPIFRFKMRCHMCPNIIELQTNPKGLDYVVHSGGKRKEERWNPEDFEQILTTDREDKKRMLTDAMYMLEHTVGDELKAKEKKSELGLLQEHQDKFMIDYDLNSIARKRLRVDRERLSVAAEKDASFADRTCVDVVKLLPESAADSAVATGITELHRRFSISGKKNWRQTLMEGVPLTVSGSKLSSAQKLIRNLSHKNKRMAEMTTRAVHGVNFDCPVNVPSKPHPAGLVSYCSSEDDD